VHVSKETSEPVAYECSGSNDDTAVFQITERRISGYNPNNKSAEILVGR
jgi:hypothetical protein